MKIKKKSLDHFSALYVGQTGNFRFRFHFNQIDDIWTTPILWAKKAFDLIEQNSPPWSNIDEGFNSSSRFMEQVSSKNSQWKGKLFFSFLSTYECSLRTFLLWHDPSSKEKSFSWFFEDTTKIVEKGGQEPLRKCGLLVQPMSQWNGKNYRRAFLVLQSIIFSWRFKMTKINEKDKVDVLVLFFPTHFGHLNSRRD